MALSQSTNKSNRFYTIAVIIDNHLNYCTDAKRLAEKLEVKVHHIYKKLKDPDYKIPKFRKHLHLVRRVKEPITMYNNRAWTWEHDFFNDGLPTKFSYMDEY